MTERGGKGERGRLEGGWGEGNRWEAREQKESTQNN